MALLARAVAVRAAHLRRVRMNRNGEENTKRVKMMQTNDICDGGAYFVLEAEPSAGASSPQKAPSLQRTRAARAPPRVKWIRAREREPKTAREKEMETEREKAWGRWWWGVWAILRV